MSPTTSTVVMDPISVKVTYFQVVSPPFALEFSKMISTVFVYAYVIDNLVSFSIFMRGQIYTVVVFFILS